MPQQKDDQQKTPSSSSSVVQEIHLQKSSLTALDSSVSETNFDRITSFGNLQFGKEVKSKVLGYIKRIINRNPLYLLLWNEVVVTLCLIATSLDPLFCYVFIADDGRHCVGFHNNLRKIAVVLRSIIDFLYIVLMFFHFKFGCSSFSSTPTLYDTFWKRAWKLSLSYFTVDLLAVLPLPQVVVLFVIPKLKMSKFIGGMRSLKYILIIQYLPRVFRIYSFQKKVRWNSSILPESAGAKAAFNLFLYMLASHSFGAFWYLFTVERKADCWKEHCEHCLINCNYSASEINGSKLLDGICFSSMDENESKLRPFDFGIFNDGIRRQVVNSTDFIWKTSYCFWWGLQKLSSLGQDLKTSDSLREIYFAVAITISGLLLFAFLVGNLQTYLQLTTARLEEMRLKGQDIELWMAYHSLPRKLKKQIKKFEKYRWQETKGVNLEKLLQNLPRDLRRETKRHLCLDAISKVRMFANMDENEKLMDAIYDYLKPVFYVEHNFIIKEGEPLDGMIFITRGKILAYNSSNDTEKNGDSESSSSSSSSSTWLTKGEMYGQDLLDAALVLNPSTNFVIPKCTKTLRAHSKVEAFVLMATDLKALINKFWWVFSKNTSSREIWAALVVQLAWRRHYNRKRHRYP